MGSSFDKAGCTWKVRKWQKKVEGVLKVWLFQKVDDILHKIHSQRTSAQSR